jgi:hypothetical protein
VKNKLLQQTEDAIEAGLAPDTRREYQRLVLAGMKAALKDGPKGILRNLPQSKDPVRDCAIGAVNVTFAMIKEAKGQVPEKAVVPACYALMLHALDIAAGIGKVEITNQVIAQATKIATDRIFAASRISPQMLNKAAGAVNGLRKDPTKMDKVMLAIGAHRDPRASMPTPGLQEEATDGAA